MSAGGAEGGPLGGALIAVSERGLDAAGNVRGFLIGGKMPGEFTVKRKNDFDIVDCALTPEGELLLLERFFTWRSGVAMRIRRVAFASVRPGALLDGPALIEADLGYQIDNMEGLSVHRAANGETILTLVSDDNFSLIQRTLLLQFALIDR
ncbi:MAG: esterase-like activity of phytase family protein [Pseudorhodoplanes sp.]|nr:esterase-like activity of phytase family protein [Pseudorhodoplanes sp.]